MTNLQGASIILAVHELREGCWYIFNYSKEDTVVTGPFSSPAEALKSAADKRATASEEVP